MTAAGTRMRSMELESLDGQLGKFTKAALQINNEMALVFDGQLMAPSLKALIRMINSKAFE
jgi:hypothetical protein